MQFGKAVGVACSSFAVTNVDDLFVLVTFFAEASVNNNKIITPLKITLGQYIGFTIIIIISMIGYGASLVMPSEPIGFLGLLPILLGIYKLIQLVLPNIRPAVEEEDEEDTDTERTTMAGLKSIFKVSLITVMNGGDNIGTYVPLFAQAKGAEIAVYIVIYYIMLALWCLSAFLIMKQKHVLRIAQKYARAVIPILYIGLGVYITVKSGCYSWSIRRINDSGSSKTGDLGTIIMAVVTTVAFLICIGAILWLRLRKRVTYPPPNLEDLDLRGLDADRDSDTNRMRPEEAGRQSPDFKDLSSQPMFGEGESGSSTTLLPLTPAFNVESQRGVKG
ncbi:hypothetical protein AA313_de0209255 [Arthrobotrys entomopaga]|nr:hypothetical protein AA313_de0209255 [Arthrobotrys entomopaga]